MIKIANLTQTTDIANDDQIRKKNVSGLRHVNSRCRALKFKNPRSLKNVNSQRFEIQKITGLDPD